MSNVTFKGKMVETCGELPETGSVAPDFLLTKMDLNDVTLNDMKGSPTVLSVIPSIDTGVCAQSERKFNEDAVRLEGIKVFSVSRDLPFALNRFCAAEGIDKVTPVSELRNLDFGERYGLRMVTGPLAGLLARCVIVLDGDGMIRYTQLVPEIAEEPDYEKVYQFLKEM